VSSVHPCEAGVQVPLVHTLLDHGAAINGISNDCSPLVTVLAFWYGSAAAALVERGARVDTVATASGMGRLDLVREMVTDEGTVRDDVPLLDVPWLGFGNDPQANLELAAVWAGIHGHPDVESFFMQRGVNTRARNNWGKPIA
ncbi:MAG: ankyrin repeat domain-containing protein, partial [Chloroflexota bacterium]